MLANFPLLDFLKLLWNVTFLFHRNKSNLGIKKCLTFASTTEPSGAYFGYYFTGWALYALPPYHWSEPTWPRSQKRVWFPTFPWLSPSHTSLRLSLGNLSAVECSPSDEELVGSVHCNALQLLQVHPEIWRNQSGRWSPIAEVRPLKSGRQSPAAEQRGFKTFSS